MRLFVTNTPKNELFLGSKDGVIPWLQKNELLLGLASDQLLEGSLRDRFPLLCPSFNANNPTSQLLQSRVLFPQRFLLALLLRSRLNNRKSFVSLRVLRDAHKTTRFIHTLDGIQTQHRLELVHLRNAVLLQSAHWIERVVVYRSTLRRCPTLKQKRGIRYGTQKHNRFVRSIFFRSRIHLRRRIAPFILSQHLHRLCIPHLLLILPLIHYKNPSILTSRQNLRVISGDAASSLHSLAPIKRCDRSGMACDRRYALLSRQHARF